MHMELEPELTLTQAHAILVAAEARVMAAYPAADVLIHPDPKGRAAPHGNAYFGRDGASSAGPADDPA